MIRFCSLCACASFNRSVATGTPLIYWHVPQLIIGYSDFLYSGVFGFPFLTWAWNVSDLRASRRYTSRKYIPLLAMWNIFLHFWFHNTSYYPSRLSDWFHMCLIISSKQSFGPIAWFSTPSCALPLHRGSTLLWSRSISDHSASCSPTHSLILFDWMSFPSCYVILSSVRSLLFHPLISSLFVLTFRSHIKSALP